MLGCCCFTPGPAAWGKEISQPVQPDLETESRRPAVEIYHIPHEDLDRTPGFDKEGLYLPLSEILMLIRSASRPEQEASQHTAVTCNRLELEGSLNTPLYLNGKLEFTASGHDWSATPIEEGDLS
jgi:hypothetical protein